MLSTIRLVKPLALALAVAVLTASPVLASEDPPRTDYPSAYDNEALEQWHDTQHWQYDTDYLFGATRGLERAGVPAMARPAAWIFSVPFDLASLPLAALAGLLGN
jgi:hypothetical protein